MTPSKKNAVTVTIGTKYQLGACICCANVMAPNETPSAALDMGERLALRVCKGCAAQLIEQLKEFTCN